MSGHAQEKNEDFLGEPESRKSLISSDLRHMATQNDTDFYIPACAILLTNRDFPALM